MTITSVTKANQGGASSSDYSGVPASITFNGGDTEKTISFSAASDSDNDDGESVKLGFGNLPAGVSAGSTNETVVSITDDDVPSVEVSFEQGSYTVAEGSSVTVTVKLNTEPERTVTVPLTKANQGGATSADYSVPANVIFNGGDTEKTITFAATQDTVDDDGESVKLGFGSSLPTGVSAGTPNESVVSITDDDVPGVSVKFTQATYTVAEGSSINITVTLSADPERTVTIPLSLTNQGGASGDDHSLVPNSVTFNAGQTGRTFSFQADEDTVDDDGESVKIGFGNLPTGVTAGTPSETTVSITDDDVPSITASFEHATYTVAEGNSVTVKVTLSADPERNLQIPISAANQGGASSADYTLGGTSVNINSGSTTGTVTFTATQDTLDDDGESVKLTLGTLPGGVNRGTTDETTVSITDDDVPSVNVSFEQGSYTVAEGSTVTVKVKLDAEPERTVTVPLTKANQGGASNSDYSGVPASVTFNSGETEKSITFSAASDSDNDDGESVKLGFGNLPTGVSEGSIHQRDGGLDHRRRRAAEP